MERNAAATNPGDRDAEIGLQRRITLFVCCFEHGHQKSAAMQTMLRSAAQPLVIEMNETIVALDRSTDGNCCRAGPGTRP